MINNPTHDIHAQVEELLPFFVAGTLPPQEGDFVRQHLAACPRCKQSLTEWFEIAHAVRTEAAAWSSKLPPLSPRVRARLRSSKTANNSSARFNRLSLTLVAAMITVVFISGVLLYSRNRGDNTEVAAAPTDTQTVIPPTFTAAITATPEVSSTPTLTIPTLDPALQPAIPTQTDIASSKLPASNTPYPPTATPLPLLPTPTEGFSLLAPPPSQTPIPSPTPLAGCLAVPYQPGDIYLYSGPDTRFDLQWIVTAEVVLIVNGRTDNGWYQVSFEMANSTRQGWLNGTVVYLMGQYCSVLPILPVPITPIPTETPVAVIDVPAEATAE